MAYGKGRATGYTDYFKNRSKTPTDDEDDEMGETIIPRGAKPRPKPNTDIPTSAEERKEAIKRRLRRKVGK